MGVPARKPDVLTRVQGAGLGLLITCVAVTALAFARDLLAPLSLAILVALSLSPLVRWLSKALPRALASALVVSALVGAVAGTAYALSDEAAAVIERLPAVVRQLRQTVQTAMRQQGIVAQFQKAASELQQLSDEATPGTQVSVATPSIDITRGVLSGTRDAATIAMQGLLGIFLVYFLLSTGDLMKVKLIRISGPRLSRRNVTEQVIDQILDQVGRFVFYLAISGGVVGVLTWLAFAAMGMPYAALWGVAAGVLNCLPYAGPTIVLAGSFIVALMQFQDLGWAGGVALASLIITSLEGFVLAPVLFGRWSRVNPVAVFVAVMFWTWLWGPIGALLALPLLVTMKVVADAVPDLSAVSELIADR